MGNFQVFPPFILMPRFSDRKYNDGFLYVCLPELDWAKQSIQRANYDVPELLIRDS